MLYALLGFIFYWSFMRGIGTYPLLDVDETRYVDMAKEMFNSKDYLTLYLNGDFFFEKPPLFFWLECLAFKLTGAISEFSARIPNILISLIPAGAIIYLCRKVKDDKFAIIVSMVLFTSLEYVFMTKIAILDSLFTSLCACSILFYFCTYFCEEKNKKYFWMLVYIFSGLSVLAKGLPGVIIPAIIIAVSSLIYKSQKEVIKSTPFLLLFLLITLPWHIAMYNLHGNLFFEEYIIKHHILRFLGSDIINRNEPFYFYFVTLLWGLFPHIFILLSKIFNIKKIRIDINDNFQKFMILNVVAISSILIFFSLSGAKLITYILPSYPFFAVIIGNMWREYTAKGGKNIDISLVILNLFLGFGLMMIIIAGYFMPEEMYENFKIIQFGSIMLILPFIIISSFLIHKQKRFKTFLLLCVFISVVSGIMTQYIYQFNYTFGQNDLMKYAKKAKENNRTISAYLTGRKYSLLYYSDKSKIDFKTKEDTLWLDNELKKKNNIVIIRNKEIENLPVKITEKGVKYSIIERVQNEKG